MREGRHTITGRHQWIWRTVGWSMILSSLAMVAALLIHRFVIEYGWTPTLIVLGWIALYAGGLFILARESP